MLNVARGLALVFSGLPADSTSNDTPAFQPGGDGARLLGSIVPGFEVPNLVLVLFGAAIVASLVLSKTVFGRYTFALGSNEEATDSPASTSDAWKIGVYAGRRAVRGAGRRAHRRPAELSPARLLASAYELGRDSRPP